VKIKVIVLFVLFYFISINAQNAIKETKEEHDARKQWWRDARFGLFIHWGLYSVPAGEWQGKTNYAEWIRNNAEIPIDVYEKFVPQFNPVKFSAEEWVKTAKNAGMKYIVITSKHHDGFCMFDTKYTDFDIMSTPFKRDVLKELSEACKKEGIKLCFYYSIMDWHHPDYLPRRGWEKDRSTEGADFDRYVQYMKNQLKELVTNYGDIGVLWFDGEWEGTWNEERGTDLYYYVRNLKPDIIVNNRVDPSRGGLTGFSANEKQIGDFGTPEQQIPAEGLPGVDWESCMTMNDHWGYNKNDKNFKSVKSIIQMLTDIASKGGNYLLNVGPTSEGVFPKESIEILGEIGKWMKTNGEAIYGTSASPFKQLKWGRCTQKSIGDKTRLYLHVFDWPENGKLVVPGIYSDAVQSYLLADESKTNLKVERDQDALIISIPLKAPDQNNSVIVLDVAGKPDVNNPPLFESSDKIFIKDLDVTIKSERQNVDLRYTVDGSIPTTESSLVRGPIKLTETTTLTARCFRDGKPVSSSASDTFTKVVPDEATQVDNAEEGIGFKYFEGQWEKIPDFSLLKPVAEGVLDNISIKGKKSADYFAFEFSGFVKIPEDGVYTFYTASDDGSNLYIDDKMLVDNDFPHGLEEKSGVIALQKGYHPFVTSFFEAAGSDELKVYIRGPGIEKQLIPADLLYHMK